MNTTGKKMRKASGLNRHGIHFQKHSRKRKSKRFGAAKKLAN